MSISKSKRRYSVSLTPAVVERFQLLAKSVGIPTTISNLCEDALLQTCTLLQVVKETGKFSSDDLRKIMGTQMQLIEEDERKQDVIEKRQETKDKRGIARDSRTANSAAKN